MVSPEEAPANQQPPHEGTASQAASQSQMQPTPLGEETIEPRGVADTKPSAGEVTALMLGATVDLAPAGLSPTIETTGGGNSHPATLAYSRSDNSLAQRPEVDGYVIMSVLGRGGMGVVYKARQKKLNRTIALKMVLSGAHSTSEQLTRFYSEAEAVAHLQHPNIVQIYEVGEHNGLPYFSLEFVDGGCLADKIGGKPQPVLEAAKCVAVIALAMAYAHEHGIIHRDLKPANVLLTRDGQPKITDFGLAKRLEGDSSQTKDGTLMGTPNYMAPEQARGDVKEVGPLADVYALGVILYELLTGRTPFLGSSIIDTLQQVRNHDPVPPSRLQPKVSRDLETICLKCLEKDPAKRYCSAALLADDLYRYVKGEPILARPVSAPERLWRWCQRNKGIAALSAAVLLLLVSLAVGSTSAAIVMSRQAEQVRQEKVAAEDARDAARVNENKAVTARQEADRNADAAKLAQGQAESARQLAEHNAARADENAKRAEKQRELAIGALDTLVTKVQNQLGDTARTLRLKRDLLETAFDGLNKVAEIGGDAGNADATRAEAHLRMGRIFIELGHSEAARKEYLAGSEIYRKLVTAEPSNNQLKFNFARALTRVASVSLLVGDVSGAEQHALETLRVRGELFKVIPRPDMARNLARAHLQLGDVLRDSQRAGEADGQYRRALSIQEQLFPKTEAKDKPGLELELRSTCERIGELHLIWKKDARAARRYFEKSLAIAQAAADVPNATKTARQNLALTMSRLGMVSRRLGEGESAAKYFGQSLELWQALAAEEDPDVLLAQGELALALGRAGRHAEAARQAEHLERLSPEYARNLYNVGCCYALCAGALDALTAVESNEERQILRASYAQKAIERLTSSAALGRPEDVSFMRLDPDLDAIRNEKEFEALMDSISKKNKG